MLVDYFPKHDVSVIQLGAGSQSDQKQVTVGVLLARVNQRQQAWLTVLYLKGLIFEEVVLAPNGDFGFAVQTVHDEISCLEVFILNYFMEAGVFVACWFVFPEVFACAELAEVLGSFRADVLEELEC